MFKDPTKESNQLLQNLFLIGAKILNRFSYISYLAINFGSSLNNLTRYRLLSQTNKPEVTALRREELWKLAIKKIAGKPFVGFEFGVAWGYQTDFWMKNCKSLSKWHGYDTFTGLPESWRHYSKGHFSNEGKPPEINDDRLDWHVGLVQDTFDISHMQNIKSEENRFISFDLDLFTPTYFILSKLISVLKKGDLVYFDEPHDPDEGALIHLLIMLNRDKLVIVGETPCQLLFEVIGTDLVFPEYIQ